MKAAIYTDFQGEINIEEVPSPTPKSDGVIIAVKASGICRSDWHGWMGHDPDIQLPHVPGHELAGVIEAIGKDVRNFNIGDRVTVPFVCGCGLCRECSTGNQQVCDHQSQPGFTHWGSFAKYVAIDYADTNLVKLPEEIDFATAAILGCRFITSYRAIVHQGRVKEGDYVVVHGCGGVGLSAIMIASALGAQVVAVDISKDSLALAKELGAHKLVNAVEHPFIVEEIQSLTDGGAHVSIDALGSEETCFNSVANLRKRGRHIQVGLMTEDDQHARVPIARVLADELEILGSHGMQAHKYPEMLDMILAGRLQPNRLIEKTVSLKEGTDALMTMNQFKAKGVWVIDKF